MAQKNVQRGRTQKEAGDIVDVTYPAKFSTNTMDRLRRRKQETGVAINALIRQAVEKELSAVHVPEKNDAGGGARLPLANAVKSTRAQEPIPILAKIPAGQFALIGALREPLDYLLPDGIKATDDAFALQVTGDSMTNGSWRGGGIRDEDYVVLVSETDVDHIDGEIAAVVKHDNTSTLKRIFWRDDQVLLRPLNPEYPDQVINLDEVAAVYVVCDVVPKDEARFASDDIDEDAEVEDIKPKPDLRIRRSSSSGY